MTTSADWRVRYAVILAVGIALVGIGALGASNALIAKPSTTASHGITYYLLPFVCLALLYGLIRPQGVFRNFARSTGPAVRHGWYLLVVAVILSGLSLLGLPATQRTMPQATTILIYLLITILTATFEELLCRGLIQNILVRGFHASNTSAWRAIVVSSLIFSLMHFANLTVRPEYVIGTITQVIYTLCIGILLGTIYYLSGDLLAVIVLHAGFNFFGSLIDLFHTPVAQTATDMPVQAAIIQIVLLLPAVVIALRHYRRLAPSTAQD
ncbi:MAG: type II CAAX endopeptidase family protein [Bowdeniella nasicola]|nr:type II CAAX endopeptidase family protein [Bowdeniella nasicola]